MTDEEARGVHSLAVLTIAGFAIFSAIAHFLVWQWRPWLGKPLGYAAAQLLDVAQTATRHLS
ncbi:MAG TPA: light-harvesting protein [Gemmatimonadaceae bacterium]|nr:light-harvesting protein [Gemmatimonadaceae bacterium]